MLLSVIHVLPLLNTDADPLKKAAKAGSEQCLPKHFLKLLSVHNNGDNVEGLGNRQFTKLQWGEFKIL